MEQYNIRSSKYKEVLKWLEDNIQENYRADSSYYSMSAVSQFIEWRSKDKETWVLRVAGFNPRVYIEFKNPAHKEIFAKWVSDESNHLE